MKLYWARQACSMAIHLLLEETGAPFGQQAISFASEEQKSPAFLAVNPKAKVPTLVLDDGAVLTELPAIAFYVASRFPEAGLLPREPLQQARALEWMDYAVATIHMRGFARIFKPENYSADGDRELVRQQGFQFVEDGFAIFAKALAGRDWLLGEFSIADASLFMLEWWYARRLERPLPAPLAAHFQRMLARPSVQRMLATEGLEA